MAYRTCQFIRILKRETLEACILEAYENYVFERSEDLIPEIRSMLFHYLKQFNVPRELAPVCKKIITLEDLKTLENINEYNFNKLKLIL